MNKSILCLMTILLLIGSCGLIRTLKPSASLTAAETAELIDDRIAYVNDQILILMQSEQWKNADADTRITLASDMLRPLKKMRYISHLFYDKENQQYSFCFCDGSRGGICI